MSGALIAGLGTLLVVAGYMVVKKFGRSRCAVDHCSGCLTCESPAVELQKKQTERLDELFQMIKQIAPHTGEADLGIPVTRVPEPPEVARPTTNGEL